MQANGAEMLRLAAIFLMDAGIRTCAPIHDALLIEAPLDELERDISRTQELMADASAIVLDGFRLRSDAEVVVYPDRYRDPRGEGMWSTISHLMEETSHAKLQFSGATLLRRCGSAEHLSYLISFKE